MVIIVQKIVGGQIVKRKTITPAVIISWYLKEKNIQYRNLQINSISNLTHYYIVYAVGGV